MGERCHEDVRPVLLNPSGCLVHSPTQAAQFLRGFFGQITRENSLARSRRS
jgi:hypothetical protein